MKKSLPATLILVISFLLGARSPAETETPTTTPRPSETAAPTITATPTITPTATETTTPTPSVTPENASPGAVGIGDSYFPGMGNGGYDVQHYTLDLTVDVEENHITGIATIDAIATQNLSSFNLDFIGFDIHEVALDGLDTPFGRSEGELRIIPVHPIGGGNAFQVVIKYSGIPGDTGDTTVTSRATSWIQYEGGIMVAGEPTGSSGWFPVNEHPADKAAYTFVITVPEPYVVAANGILEDTIDLGNSRTYVWDTDEPMASYLVTVNIAEFDVETRLGPDDLLIRNYFARGVPFSARQNFDRTPEMIAYFNERFGPYPFDVYGVVVHDLPLGFALETQTLSFFGSSFHDENVVVHELAHQWFGDSVSLSRWQDIWLNEGFASYASSLWLEHTLGEAALIADITAKYRNMAPGTPVFEVPKDELLAGIGAFPLEGVTISREQALEALAALFGRRLTDEARATLASGLPEEGIPRENILGLIEEIEFSHVTLTNFHVSGFFSALGLDGLINQAPQKFPTPGDPTPEGLFSGSVYQRGALTLHALRVRVGDDAFFEILQTYFARFSGGNATTEDFIAVAEEVSQENLGTFFEGWLFEDPIPDIPEMSLFRADYLP